MEYGKGKKNSFTEFLFANANKTKMIKKKKRKVPKIIYLSFFSFTNFLNFFPGMKCTKYLLFISIFSPDSGFLPVLDFLNLVENVPKSLISILEPFDKPEEKNWRIFSRVLSISLLGK